MNELRCHSTNWCMKTNEPISYKTVHIIWVILKIGIYFFRSISSESSDVFKESVWDPHLWDTPDLHDSSCTSYHNTRSLGSLKQCNASQSFGRAKVCQCDNRHQQREVVRPTSTRTSEDWQSIERQVCQCDNRKPELPDVCLQSRKRSNSLKTSRCR